MPAIIKSSAFHLRGHGPLLQAPEQFVSTVSRISSAHDVAGSIVQNSLPKSRKYANVSPDSPHQLSTMHRNRSSALM
ncbi:hypothetical protein [Desulfosarcina ovata]|uniref:hypothetical protein n=1 Tax=Desulfosarcina ovata TaxID=83564 RepID=UPI0012D2B288|nr:hypothetical protein [Desulfosarcina ovata]